MRAAAFALSWVLSGAASQAEPTTTPDAVPPWPCRLVVEEPLHSAIRDAWRRSPTLQEQCRRLADARAVVRLDWGKSDAYTQAASRIGRDSGGVTVAIVSVPPVAHAIELVAHELEHVIERVEGRDLPRAARRRGSGVWESVGGFESQRAIDIGRQVAREVAAHPVERRQRTPASKKDAPRTIGRTIVVGTIETHTIRAALAALPRTPDRIEVVAADEMPPEIRERIHRKFGFVLKGSRTIYLIRDSAVIREAERSGGPYLFILSGVIWHEMAHADGLDEAQARRREEELWRGFVSTRVVDSALGLAYLAELRTQK